MTGSPPGPSDLRHDGSAGSPEYRDHWHHLQTCEKCLSMQSWAVGRKGPRPEPCPEGERLWTQYIRASATPAPPRMRQAKQAP